MKKTWISAAVLTGVTAAGAIFLASPAEAKTGQPVINYCGDTEGSLKELIARGGKISKPGVIVDFRALAFVCAHPPLPHLTYTSFGPAGFCGLDQRGVQHVAYVCKFE